MKKRIWEIDFLRGVAIIFMIIYHLAYDLSEFYSYNIGFGNVYWTGFQILIGTLFSSLSGISRSLSRSSLKQGLITLGYGMLLTLATYLFSPEIYIRFGILHFMGVSMIIYHFIQNINTKLLLPLGVIIILVGNIFKEMTVSVSWLFPLGLTDSSFGSLDYYPLLPWFGVFLLGVFIGRVVYKEKKSIFKFELKRDAISFLGRHSLFVYLVHQPILVGILYVIHMFV